MRRGVVDDVFGRWSLPEKESRDAIGTPLFDVVWDLLAGGHETDSSVEPLDDVQDDSETIGFIELGENDSVGTQLGEGVGIAKHRSLPRGGRKHEMGLVGIGLAKERSELLKSFAVTATSTGGVDEDDVASGESLQRGNHVFGFDHHFKVDLKDLRVTAELVDGRHAK